MPIEIEQLTIRADPKEVIIQTLKDAKHRMEGLSRKDILQLGFGFTKEDMTGNFTEWNYNVTPAPANLYSKITQILKLLVIEGSVRTVKKGYSRWYYWV